MIRLIRKDGIEILLNIDMIKTIEKTPETVITLTNGEKIVVKNAVGDITEKMRAHIIGIQASNMKNSDKTNDSEKDQTDE